MDVSVIGDAFRTIQSALLLQSKLEQLDEQMETLDGHLSRVVATVVQIDRRLVRLETIEEMRSGAKPLPRIEG